MNRRFVPPAIVLVTVLALTASIGAEASTTRPAKESLAWTQLDPNRSPAKRNWAASAYDERNHQAVIFGGNTGFGGANDTWVFDGTTWTELDLAVRPDRREVMSMAYDAARHEIVLFGGTCDCETVYQDTWTFDGSSWTLRTPDTSPPPLYGATLAYDQAHREVVLFGGRNSSSTYADTWVWDGATWEQRHPETSPPARWSPAMAYSQARGGIVLFGGQDQGGTRLGDTWLWDGDNWSPVHSGTTPRERLGGGMTSFGKGVVMYGGWGGDQKTWVLRWGGWKSRAVEQSPNGGGTPAMSYDPKDRAVIYFGRTRALDTAKGTWLLHRAG